MFFLFWLFHGLAESETLNGGLGSFLFSFGQENQTKVVRVWTFSPRKIGPQTRVVFVMHGLARDARRYLKPWMAAAQRSDVLFLAPEFSEQFFPGSRAYNLGAIQPSRPPGAQACESTTFFAVERIFDEVVKSAGIKKLNYRIYGHSAGGQFVHRLILLCPDARVELAVAANAGWYTMPDFDIDFPYGLKNSAATEKGLAKSLRENLILLLGEKDNDPGHPFLNRRPGAMRQGGNRLERGLNFFHRAEREAQVLGVNLGWKVETVPGIAHDQGRMAQAAAFLLIDK
jgi:pimeloyl-ACP methyl ester carboxylesterase